MRIVLASTFVPFINGGARFSVEWLEEKLREHGHEVERFYLPGISALNFLLHGALDGGCTSSLRFDPLGKSVAQEVLDFPVPVSAALARRLEAAE